MLSLLFLPCCLHAKTIYVVSVGICNYQYIRGLKNTETDAQSIAELYKTHTTHVKMLLGAQATRANILSALTSYFSQAKEDDVVVFFFSGHGGKGGLCAYDTRSDATMVSYNQIQNAIKSCKADNKQLFIDACFSGGLRTTDKKSETQKAYKPTTQGVMLFLSSRTGEMSQENPWSENGFYTQYLIKGMKGAADTNRDKIITAKEIFQYVSANVAERTRKKQNPVMWGNFNDGMHIMNWNPMLK